MNNRDGFVEVPLSRGKVAIVDADDAGGILKYNWQAIATRSGKGFYARRVDEESPYRDKRIMMHRQIMAAPRGMLVDHIDRNGLNNRRSNLRLCSNAENTRNRSLYRNNSTGFKGVYTNKDCKDWIAAIRGRYLGLYPSAELAARAYDTAALQAYGKFASLNFPDDFRPIEPSVTEIRPNNTSGFTGVIRVVKKGRVRWYARIFRDGKIIHVGTFDSPDEAAAAREVRLNSISECR